MKPFVLSMKYPGFPVVEFRMINHRITHIFRKRTQNKQKNYCCIQRTYCRNLLPYKFVQRRHLSCRYLYSANGWVEVLPE